MSVSGECVSGFSLPLSSIHDWSFLIDLAYISYKKTEKEETFCFHADEQNLLTLRSSLHFLLVAKKKFNPESSESTLENCAVCGELVQSAPSSRALPLCLCCYSIGGKQGRSFHFHNGYYFDFTYTGRFDVIAKQAAPRAFHKNYQASESFQERMCPLWFKVRNYSLWSALLLFLMGGAWGFMQLEYLSGSFWNALVFSAMLFSFVTLSFTGYYWSALMLEGAWKPYICPTRWELLNRLMELGDEEAVQSQLSELGLEEHPGFLLNQAQMYFSLGKQEKANECLKKARELSPQHPLLEKVELFYNS